MKKNTLKGRSLVIISTLFLFFFFYVTYFLNLTSMFYLYYIVSLTCVVFMSSNLVFMMLKFINLKTEKYRNSERKTAKKFQAIIEKIKLRRLENAKKKGKSVKEEKKRKKLNIKISSVFRVICLFIYFMSLYSCIKGMVFHFMENPFNIFDNPINGVFMLIFALICFILGRFIKYSENNSEFVQTLLDNNSVFLKILSIMFITVSVSIFIEYYAKVIFQKPIGNVLMILFFYCAAFTVISSVIIVVRKDFCTKPIIKIPLPYIGNKQDEKRESFAEYLEKNTGASMRSLWSVRFIKKIAPSAVVISVIALWLATGFTVVQNYQQAAVYRIGKLQDKILMPGIHYTFPYPIDKVKVYDTEKLNKTTIGYKSENSTDNIWTASHGANEHKLLLGGGDELVSINLRLEYKISDLKKYLTVSVSPELLMEATAYELVLDKTISTDLSSLLSTDRYEFARTFKDELQMLLTERDIGLEVVSVVLESIHPPVEIAHVYHGLISAGITAEKEIAEAEGYAAVTKAEAEASSNTSVGMANSEYSRKTAEATAAVAEFMAAAEADSQYGGTYRYQKYLNSVRQAYGKANLIILGDGVDRSSIILGSFNAPPGKEYPADETQESEEIQSQEE